MALVLLDIVVKKLELYIVDYTTKKKLIIYNKNLSFILIKGLGNVIDYNI